MSIFTTIGHFFGDLFNAIKRAYDNLNTDEQEAAKTASGIIAVINANLTALPADVWAAIQKAYPNISEATVTAALTKVSTTLTTLLPGTLETAITALQGYLSKYTGNEWIVITKSVVALIANELLPGTVIQKIELVLEWVYQTFIKGKVA